MFNKDFYPTPSKVIEQILQGVDIHNKIILEPSAGSGNIVDYLLQNGAKEVLTCEIEPKLARIISSKSTYLKADFLEVRSEEISHIDLIVMNPPFSADEKHILHAWDIAPNGCQIIALCNNATLINPYTTERKKLKEIIELNGRSENLRNCFSDAERSTGAEIGCIYLYKQKAGEDEFEGFFDLNEDYDKGEEGIAQYNYVRDIVGRYVQAVQMFDEVKSISDKINALTKPISQSGVKFGAYKTGYTNYESSEITRDFFKKDLQKRSWQKVFDELNMHKYATKGVRETINAFVEKQTHVPFTVKNVYQMIKLIIGTHESRMNQVLVEAFDLICSFSDENTTAGKKWKTNCDYMVKKKFIVPSICDNFSRWKSGYVDIGNGRNVDYIEDVIRALCYITATNFDEVQRLHSFSRNIHNNKTYNSRDYVSMCWGEWYEWKPFFRIKGFKVGTMHFEFLDDDVWMKFNTLVAKTKGWQLPKARKPKASRKKTKVEI